MISMQILFTQKQRKQSYRQTSDGMSSNDSPSWVSRVINKAEDTNINKLTLESRKCVKQVVVLFHLAYFDSRTQK